MGAPQSAGSRTKGGTTAVEASRRVIRSSQIPTDTNLVTQQVSHSFLVQQLRVIRTCLSSPGGPGVLLFSVVVCEPGQLPSSS